MRLNPAIPDRMALFAKVFTEFDSESINLWRTLTGGCPKPRVVAPHMSCPGKEIEDRKAVNECVRGRPAPTILKCLCRVNRGM
jgi:hypothetical protein